MGPPGLGAKAKIDLGTGGANEGLPHGTHLKDCRALHVLSCLVVVEEHKGILPRS